ncbi:putative inactive purple acid phosphatase 9 [Abeliophyllum distichum]|uniref:Inactive purple acid phosphatase 9 n=1 Tax=Abeliophyllum distichum TaxID=126358 RepID=A0ABD1VZR7_9LAMI
MAGTGNRPWETRADHSDDPIFPQLAQSLYHGGEFRYTRRHAAKDKLTLSYDGNHDGKVHDTLEIMAPGQALTSSSTGDDARASWSGKNLPFRCTLRSRGCLY